MDGINLKQAPSPVKNVRSNFDLSFNRKTDLKFGQLFPFLMEPVMPGDNYSISYNYLLRMAPFISQVFQKYVVAFDYYYVPNRLLYKNFDNFLTAGYDGKRTYIHPYLDLGSLRDVIVANTFDISHSIFNALDIPTLYYLNAQTKVPGHYVNALPFYAYLRVFLDYWIGTGTALNSIKENMLNNKYLVGDGDCTQDFATLYNQLRNGGSQFSSYLFELLPRLYPLDYFTEARPDPQLGPVMTIPLSLVNTDTNGTQTFQFLNYAGSNGTQTPLIRFNNGSKNISLSDSSGTNNIVVNGSVFDNTATIPDFYSAARVQEFLTLMGFSGFSPEDTIAAEFGVKNSDERLSRSEFLFHDQHVVEIGEVFSNNVNVPNATQGATEFNDLPGVGTAIAKSNNGSRGFKKFIPEHGFIVGLCSVYPEAAYSEGLPRIYNQLDRFDYPHPMFAELGMQSIKNKELSVDLSTLDWDNDFAYTPRYSEYKVHTNKVNGSLQNSLNYMTGSRRFHPLPNSNEPYVQPTFNDNFLRVLPGLDHLNRTFNVTSNYPYDCPLFLDIQNTIFANRQLPYYGLPKFGV